MSLPLPPPSSPSSCSTDDLHRLLATIELSSSSPQASFSNWAKTYHCKPSKTYMPTDSRQLPFIFELARREGSTVRPAGSGHSPSDLACTNGMMVRTDKLDKVLEVSCGFLFLEREADWSESRVVYLGVVFFFPFGYCRFWILTDRLYPPTLPPPFLPPPFRTSSSPHSHPRHRLPAHHPLCPRRRCHPRVTPLFCFSVSRSTPRRNMSSSKAASACTSCTKSSPSTTSPCPTSAPFQIRPSQESSPRPLTVPASNSA